MGCKLSKGLIQVYTGDGKGKTTASLGLALRAAGHGLKVYIFQFLKPDFLSSGEAKAISLFSPYITIDGLKIDWWSLKSFKNKDHIERMKEILADKWPNLVETLNSKRYDLIILDEINNCLFCNLIDADHVLDILKKKPLNTEIVLTGRNAPKEIVEMADLVTEMKIIKHPYNSSVKARKGIEY